MGRGRTIPAASRVVSHTARSPADPHTSRSLREAIAKDIRSSFTPERNPQSGSYSLQFTAKLKYASLLLF